MPGRKSSSNKILCVKSSMELAEVLHQIKVQLHGQNVSGAFLSSSTIADVCASIKAKWNFTCSSVSGASILVMRRRFGSSIRTVQVLNILVDNVTERFTSLSLLIISQSKHRFQLYVHILILHTSTIITLYSVGQLQNHPQSQSCDSYSYSCRISYGSSRPPSVVLIFLILILCYIFVRHTVLLVDLSLHDFELILLRSLLVANLSAGFRTLIISGQEVRILVDNSCVVLYSARGNHPFEHAANHG